MSHTSEYSEHSALLGDADSITERGERPKVSTSQGVYLSTDASFDEVNAMLCTNSRGLVSFFSELKNRKSQILSSIYDLDT